MRTRPTHAPTARRTLVLAAMALGVACAHPADDPTPPSTVDPPGHLGDPLDAWLTPGPRTCVRTVETRIAGSTPSADDTTDAIAVRLDARTADAVRVRVEGRDPWQLERTGAEVAVTVFGTRIPLTRAPDSDPRRPTWIGTHAPVQVPGGATASSWQLAVCDPAGCDRCADPGGGEACDACDAPLTEACPDGTVERTVTTTMVDGQRVVRERCAPPP